MALADGDLTLRGFREGDRAALLGLLAEPEVMRWWPVPDFVPEHGWVIEHAGELSGWLEYHEESYEQGAPPLHARPERRQRTGDSLLPGERLRAGRRDARVRAQPERGLERRAADGADRGRSGRAGRADRK
jgi:hypothetical protein